MRKKQEVIDRLAKHLPLLQEEIEKWDRDEWREDWWSWQRAVAELVEAAGDAIDLLTSECPRAGRCAIVEENLPDAR